MAATLLPAIEQIISKCQVTHSFQQIAYAGIAGINIRKLVWVVRHLNSITTVRETICQNVTTDIVYF